MAKRKKSNMVTRRVVESSVYDVYTKDKENGGLVKLDTITIKGRPSTKELCEKYNVESVVTDLVKTNVKLWGVEIDKFMELAVEVKDEEEGADNE